MNRKKQIIRLVVGIVIGAVFLFLALRKVDFTQMARAFQNANYGYLLPTIPILFLSHFLRALRWRYLLYPIKPVDTSSLFSALIIGYMANVFMPAHLGELLRAYVLGKKRDVSASSAFATIVMERIIDVFALLALMALAILIYPFPAWMKNSGYIMLAGAVGLLALLLLLKTHTVKAQKILSCMIRPLPERFQDKVMRLIENFISGIVPLRQRSDYLTVTVLSIVIWACYGLVFYFALNAFDFVLIYQLPWSASLILLVITTIAVVVPSSPGYVGTYHYLCQISLAIFGVPPAPALSFAAVVHAIMFLPVLVVGLILAYVEGVSLTAIALSKTDTPMLR